jgi:predicted CoA-substrate-specific enzyme activase
MTYFLGIDIGSGYAKAVVCEDLQAVSWSVRPSGGDYKAAAWVVAGQALDNIGLTMDDVCGSRATGHGAGTVDFALGTSNDIVCHARGIHQIFRNVGVLVDIGAHFSKAVKLDGRGKVANFVMNEKCAGGSGKFLQIIARILHMDLNEIGPLSLTATKPVEFTTSCSVFAESEAVSRVAEGVLPADILAGVHKSMASKIVNLVSRVGRSDAIAVTGGGAKDSGLVRAIEKELEVPGVRVAEKPQCTAAYGAALLAQVPESTS